MKRLQLPNNTKAFFYKETPFYGVTDDAYDSNEIILFGNLEDVIVTEKSISYHYFWDSVFNEDS